MTGALLAAYMFRLVCAVTAAWLAMPAQADQSSGLRRIGVLLPPEAQFPLGEGLREGLSGLGYVEGKTISIEWRPHGGSDAELCARADELARSRVELVVAFTTPAARAVLDATKLPVVFMAGDPVAAGLVDSLARPGGKTTGVSVLTTDLSVKRLEFLRLAAPKARRIAHLVTLANPNNRLQVEAAQQAARKLGLQLVTLDVHGAGGMDAFLSQLSATGPAQCWSAPRCCFSPTESESPAL